jgi:hypothetical protein
MMRVTGITIGLATLLAAGSANAAVVYDTITNFTSANQLKLLAQQNHAPMGDAFSAAFSETITSVTVQLSDSNATVTDLGSVMMYLVPDASGLPEATGTTLQGATLLGTIADNTLTGGGVANNKTVNTNDTISAGNYWLVLTSGSDPNNGDHNPVASTAAWNVITTATAQAGHALGVPATGFVSASVNTGNTALIGGIVTMSNPGNPNGALFMAQIDPAVPTPEPTSLALLGAGLAGLGVGRRCLSRKRGA